MVQIFLSHLLDNLKFRTFCSFWLIELIGNGSPVLIIYIVIRFSCVSIRLWKIYGWILLYLIPLWNNLWKMSKNMSRVHENSLSFLSHSLSLTSLEICVCWSLDMHKMAQWPICRNICLVFSTNIFCLHKTHCNVKHLENFFHETIFES